MIEKTVIIKNKMGLHARPAALLVQTASRFKSKIKILRGDQEVDGKSIMGLMTLAASAGSTLKIVADGTDEADAISAIEGVIQNGFGEE
jgi:phosphocarrier protein HPr